MSRAVSSDTESSAASIQRGDSDLYVQAEELKQAIEKDPTLSINKAVVYGQILDAYLTKNRLHSKERIGDIVQPTNNIDQLTTLVERHYKQLDERKKGNKEIRELQ